MADREQVVEDLLEENETDELVRLSADAKDPKVRDIRDDFEKYGRLSDRQRAVLAGWIADERAEYGDEEED